MIRRGPFRDVLSSYFTSTRAGATAAVGVTVAIAAFMGVALAGDHLTLTGQKNLMKAAVASGSAAATQHFSQMDIENVDDETLKATLRSIAERYLLANLPPNRRERARTNLLMTITLDRSSRTVTLSASTDLGGILFLDGLIDTHEFYVGTESGVVSTTPSTEVVLAIDVTNSMNLALDGGSPRDQPNFANYAAGEYPGTRLNIVRAAAKELVNVLTSDEVLLADDSKVAVGLVPWDFRVRLGSDERARWERENWARYPTQRVYPYPYQGAPAGGVTDTMPPEADQDPWQGCLDHRSTSGSPAPAFAPVPPWDSPFTMAYYTDQFPYAKPYGEYTVGFTCRGAQQDFCYNYTNSAPSIRAASSSIAPQQFCQQEYDASEWDFIESDMPGKPGAILPLTDDAEHVLSRINGLIADGHATYATKGVVWAHRLLDPAWKPAWGDGDTVHPLDPAGDEKVNKAIVLLTDGEDNFGADAANHLNTACTTAKQAGVWVFVVAALDLSDSSHTDFKTRLERCSSQSDDPEGQYVFVNNTTAEELRESFRNITRQLQTFRIVF